MDLNITSWLMAYSDIPFLDLYGYDLEKLTDQLLQFRDITGNSIPIKLALELRDLYTTFDPNPTPMDKREIEKRIAFLEEKVQQWMLEQSQYEEQFLIVDQFNPDHSRFEEFEKALKEYVSRCTELTPDQYNIDHVYLNQLMKVYTVGGPEALLGDVEFKWCHMEDNSIFIQPENTMTEYDKLPPKLLQQLYEMTSFDCAIQFFKMFEGTRQEILKAYHN